MVSELTLAINGGKPIRDNYLTYGRQSIDENDIQAVVNVLRGEYLTTGPAVKELEQAIASYVGVKYAVAVSNGTTALHTALVGCGIVEGDEVIVTPMTFVASVNAILYVGAIPVFADIDEKTLNIDVRDIEEKITTKTKAIIPVDFAGQPVDLDEIRELAKRYDLKVIEDGAHSLGSSYRGEKVGKQADVTTFSFHPVKPITTGEGGVVVTNDFEIYKKMEIFRSHGITRDNKLLIDKNQGNWYYEQQLLGNNYRLTDIQAALGVSQINKLDRFIQRRREIAEIYNRELEDIIEIKLPYEKEDRQSGYHLYIIRLELESIKATRKEIYEALQAEGIGVNVHYIPVYFQPYYKNLGFNKGICLITEKVYEELISLPIFPGMSEGDIIDVVNAVKKVINYYSNNGIY